MLICQSRIVDFSVKGQGYDSSCNKVMIASKYGELENMPALFQVLKTQKASLKLFRIVSFFKLWITNGNMAWNLNFAPRNLEVMTQIASDELLVSVWLE